MKQLLRLPTLLAALVVPNALPSHAADAPRILLHAQSSTAGGSCAPGLQQCASANVSGFLQNQVGFYYLYIVACSPASSAGLQEIHTGIDYDQRTVSGVDVFRWTLCADSETTGPGWFQAGGSNRIRWNSCPTAPLVVAGYFYVTAYDPSYFALVPPPADSTSMTACENQPVKLATTSLGYIGFGGEPGCNPCLGDCFYTPTEPVTWSGIKSLFRSGRPSMAPVSVTRNPSKRTVLAPTAGPPARLNRHPGSR